MYFAQPGDLDPRSPLPPSKKRKTSPDDSPSPRSGLGRRFACPFRVASPSHPALESTCLTKGWPTFHRLKEHLKRNHTSREFKARYMPDLPHLKDPTFMLEEDAERILSRRSKRKEDSDKWHEVYKAQFGSRDTPSPYVENDAVDDALETLVRFSQVPRVADKLCRDGLERMAFAGMLQRLVQEFRCERSRDSSPTYECSPDEFVEGLGCGGSHDSSPTLPVYESQPDPPVEDWCIASPTAEARLVDASAGPVWDHHFEETQLNLFYAFQESCFPKLIPLDSPDQVHQAEERDAASRMFLKAQNC